MMEKYESINGPESGISRTKFSEFVTIISISVSFSAIPDVRQKDLIVVISIPTIFKIRQKKIA